MDQIKGVGLNFKKNNFNFNGYEVIFESKRKMNQYKSFNLLF